MKIEHYLIYMTCDAPGCRARQQEYAGVSQEMARAAARKDGWKIGKPGEKDLCGDHKGRADGGKRRA